MLKIKIEAQELFDNEKQEFINVKEQTLLLEHSLVSISKWESKWKKPFLDTKKNSDKTIEETIDYIKCMTLNSNVDNDVYNFLSEKNINLINNYIKDSMTATTFYNQDSVNKLISRETVTSELIYYWMLSNNIPIECERWHINRLLTLIRIFSIKNTPPKKMSKNEIISRNAALNAARKKQLHTKG